MAIATSYIDELLRCSTRGEVQSAFARQVAPLSLPDANVLTVHLRGLQPALVPLRLAVVHTYTSDLLQPWLDLQFALQGLDVHTYHAPYGLALGEAHPESRLVGHQPEMTLLMLQREDLHPSLARPIAALGSQRLAQIRQEAVARVREIVGLFRAQATGFIVLTLLPPLAPGTLGLYDAHFVNSEQRWWAQLWADIADWMRESAPSTLLLDFDDVLRQVGREAFFDRRYWYSARFPFASRGAAAFAKRIASIGTLLKKPRAKVLVLDADNTLWGGIIGEDGMDGIALGPDHPGSAFVDFQRRILDFQQRGIILALCSKNNQADVDAVLREHPHQVLRDADFAAKRINWFPKPDNLISLAEELNLGLESFIFVDDSDHECAAMRHRLPQVDVVQVPKRATDVPWCLDHVARLEVLSLTAEDFAKTEQYALEQRRRALSAEIANQGGGAGDYLQRLQMKMRVAVDEPRHVGRLSQLSKKTNQFNLTTRRYDEQQMLSFVADPQVLVLDFSLADTFGDSGIVGLAIWRFTDPQRAELDTFLMSCRVIGRLAEAAFFRSALQLLAERGVQELVADYLPTAKNELVSSFLADQGFSADIDGRWHLQLTADSVRPASALPIAVNVSNSDAHITEPISA